MQYGCTSCGKIVELDAKGEFARNHRKRKTGPAGTWAPRSVRGGSGWCDGSGRAKQFLVEVQDAQS